MKLKNKVKLLGSFLASGIFSVVLGLLFQSSALAASTGTYYEWTGAASTTAGLSGCTSNCWSVPGNWKVSTDGGTTYAPATTAPQSSDNSGTGDNIVFDPTTLTASVTVNNDLTSLIVNSINYSGTGTATAFYYTIAGNSLSLGSGGMTSSTGYYNLYLDNSVSLSSNVTISGLGLNINSSSTFNAGIYNITLSGGGLVNNGDIISSGAIDFIPQKGSLGGLVFNVADSGITGTVTVPDIQVTVPNSFGTATIIDSGSLYFINFNGANFANNISIGGNLNAYGYSNANGYNGYNTEGNINLTGNVTLTSNTITYGNGTVTISGPLSGSYTLTNPAGSYAKLVINSSNNTSQTSNGTYLSALEITTLSAGTNASTGYIDVYGNQEEIVDGIGGITNVYYGGLLKGIGSVNSLTMYANSTVSPGDAPGCITVTNNLYLGGIYQEEIGGTTPCSGYDQLIVNGNVILNDGLTPPTSGVLQVSLINGFVPQVGQSFEIINNQGSNPVSGTFANQLEGSSITVSGVVFKISYVGGTNKQDVVLTVVSVPATTTAPIVKVPGTPDTGFGLTSFNTAIPLVGAISLAGGLLIISRGLPKFSSKKR